VVEYYVHRYGGRFIDNRYGAGSGQIWLEEVRCSGPETHIAYCQHDGWAVNKCSHSEDVSVSCIPGIVTNSFQFKRELFFFNLRKTILPQCANGITGRSVTRHCCKAHSKINRIMGNLTPL